MSTRWSKAPAVKLAAVSLGVLFAGSALAAGSPGSNGLSHSASGTREPSVSPLKSYSHSYKGSFGRTGTAKGESLDSINNPKTNLLFIFVKDKAGTIIGDVKSVKTNATGKVNSVKVSLIANNKTVSIPATDLTYDADSMALNANLTKAQIKAM